MKTLQDVLAEAQQVVTDLEALANAPVVTPTDTEVKVENSAGGEQVFVPEKDLPPGIPVDPQTNTQA